MKNSFKTIIALLFLSQIAVAQTSRFVYQATMRLDSTAVPKTENAYLDISPEKSIFYSEKRLKRDSIVEKMRATRSFDRNLMQNLNSNMDYIIEKDLVKNTTTFKSRLGRDQYSYEEDRKIDWKILPETVKIGEYSTQKAETFFGGRKWYAWFSQDIPFQDGPYKFKGLPGLIIKVEDAKGDYSFDLKETKKIEFFPNFDTRMGTMIKVKRIDFEKQQQKFNKDPMSFFQQGNMIFAGGARGEAGGPPPPPPGMESNPERRKMMEERLREEIKQNNNPIELLK
mgnify:FL=1